MGTPANSWWDEMRQEAETLPAPPPRRPSRAGPIAAATAAAALAAGLGWWLTTSEPTTFVNRESARLQPAAAAAPVSAEVDLEQVRRGYEEFGATLASGDAGAFDRFRESCDASARADGRILDFCLAFDLMTETVAPGGVEAEARRLALVEAAVPGEPIPLRRVEAVRASLRTLGALPSVQEAQPVAPPPQVATETPPVVTNALAAAKPTPAKPAPVKAIPVKAAPAKTSAAPSRCRFLSTPADRLICANPGLKTQHDRMRAAYETALKNGADPLVIDRGQAQWRAMLNAADSRAELQALYARRTAELKAAAEEARLTPPN